MALADDAWNHALLAVVGPLFVTTLAVVAPGAASQDAAEAEMLQNHLAAGYELRNLLSMIGYCGVYNSSAPVD